MRPCVDNLVVAFVVGYETHVVVRRDLLHLVVAAFHDFFFLLGNDDVVEVERKAAHVSHAVAEVLDTVEELTGTCHADCFYYLRNNVAK